MKSKYIGIAAALPLSLLLAACSPDDEPSAMDNVSENQQEYQNTATDPAGPREATPPSNLSNE
jgi:major membrane immunogen (membrane-anchored lipoprotein)